MLRANAWTEQVAVAHVQYNMMTQFDPDADPNSAAKALKAWKSVENRSGPPEDFSGSLHFRKEPINVAFILDFMSRTACRRAHHAQRGGLFDQLNLLLLRCKSIADDKSDIRNIIVCHQLKNTETELHTRYFWVKY